MEELREINYTMAHCHNEQIYRTLAQEKRQIELEIFGQNKKGILKQNPNPAENKTVQINREDNYKESGSRIPKSSGYRQRKMQAEYPHKKEVIL